MKKIFSKVILVYLKALARLALKHHQPKLIGIAGSVGKTSLKNALQVILQEHGATYATSGNSETGLPLGILGLQIKDYSVWGWLKILIQAPFKINFAKSLKYLILEMGTDGLTEPQNMSYLLSIVRPDVAIMLNASACHTEQFGQALTPEQDSLLIDAKLDFVQQALANEDAKIVTQSDCQVAIYNSQDKFIVQALSGWIDNSPKAKLMSFGQNQAQAQLLEYKVSLEGTFYKLKVLDQEHSLNFAKQVLPEEYWQILAAALLTSSGLNIDLAAAVKALVYNFVLPPGRGRLLEGINQSLIIDSSYNNSPEAFKSSFVLAKHLACESNRPLWILFGDMRELGQFSQTKHLEVVEYLSQCQEVILVGEESAKYILPKLQEAGTSVKWFSNSKLAGEYLKANLTRTSLILAKGSQNTIYLEEAVKQILLKLEDAQQLCRQDQHWINLKNKFFKK